jgi:uncharacterized membrane protein YhaH (DUF805 family)
VETLEEATRESSQSMVKPWMCTTLTQKFMIEQKVQGRSGRHKFNKPWFVTLIMFIGMLLALIIYGILAFRHRRLHPSSVPEVSRLTRFRIYFLTTVPPFATFLRPAS